MHVSVLILGTSVTSKSRQMSIKVAQKWFHLKMQDFDN